MKGHWQYAVTQVLLTARGLISRAGGQAFLSCRTVITFHLKKGCMQRLAELLHSQSLQSCTTSASHCSDPTQGFHCSGPLSVHASA